MLQGPVGPGTDIDMVMTINPLSFAKSPWIRPLLTGPDYQQRPRLCEKTAWSSPSVDFMLESCHTTIKP